MTTLRLSRRLGRLVGVAALACLAGTAGLSGVAVAAPQPVRSASAPTGDISWAVAPSTAKGPDGRTHFSYNDIKAGGVVNDYVGITNYSTRPVTFTVYASDGITTTAGSIGLQPASTKPVDVGGWIRVQHTTVTVPARARLNEPFTLDVPADATPGDHVGGVIASVTQAQPGGRVARDDRVGVAVYLRVAGPLHPLLSVEGVSTSGYRGTVDPFGGGDTTVTYTVHNTGNVRLSGDQSVSVTGLFGIPLVTVHPPALQDVLPGGSVRITTHVSGIVPLGPLTVRAAVTPVAVPGSPHLAVAPGTASASVSMWATPWPQLVLLLLLIAGWLLVRRRRRIRRDRQSVALAAAVARGRREAADQLAGVGARTAIRRTPSPGPTGTPDVDTTDLAPESE
jgi:hypothetical protein